MSEIGMRKINGELKRIMGENTKILKFIRKTKTGWIKEVLKEEETEKPPKTIPT